jgi:nucleotide-binding universal stress UspA family protein
LRVLIAYDGSAPAEAAVDEVLRRPWPPATEVRLLDVVERPLESAPRPGVETYAPLIERVRSSYHQDAERRIRAAVERLAARPELSASWEIRDGGAKEVILEAIRDWEPDLVVAGASSSRDTAKWVLGSVSAALVTLAPCTVELVKIVTAA